MTLSYTTREDGAGAGRFPVTAFFGHDPHHTATAADNKRLFLPAEWVQNGTVMEPDPQPIGALYAKQVVQATERAMGRSAVAVHQDLKRGLNTLATITSVAPFVGVFGTLWRIGFDTFGPLGTEKSTAMAAVFEGLSRASLPTALGLLVGLQSLWCYRYFRDRLAEFDHEMENTSLELINQLTLQFGHLNLAASINPIDDSLPFLETYSVVANEDRRCWRRSALSAGALLAVAWCVQVIRYFDHDSLPLALATRTAGQYVLLTFGLACLPAYAIWVDLMHRRASGPAVLAAAFCLCWCAVGLLVPVLRSI